MASSYRLHRRRDRLRLQQIWVFLFLPLYLLLVKSFSGISAFKTTLFYCLGGLLVLLSAADLIIQAAGSRLPRRQSLSLQDHGLSVCVLCYLLFTLLSAAFSEYPSQAWYNETAHEAAAAIFAYGLLFFCLASAQSWHPNLKYVLFAALSVFFAICLLQLLGKNPLGLYPGDLTYYDGLGENAKYSGPFLGTMGNVDLVSVFLCTLIPILTMYVWKDRSSLRWWALVLDLVCLAILLLIHVLCGIVGLAMGLVISGFVVLPLSGRGRRIYLGAVLGLGLCGLLILRLWDPPLSFLHELHEILNGRISDRFGSGRIYIWRQLLERIPDRLLFGTGPDTVRFTGLEPFRRFNEAGQLVKTANLTDAHCQPLQILYCQGLLALLSWLAMLGFAVRRWWQNRTDPVAAGLGAGMICWLCAMLFSFSSIILQPWFWVLLGLLESRARQNSRKDPLPVK